MKYRKIQKNEFQLITSIHLQAFEFFFLTTLGSSFLDTYYKSCLKSKECISICAVDEKGYMQGFAIGTVLSKGFHRRLFLKNFWVFFLQSVKLLFSNPLSIIRLLRNMDKTKNYIDDGHYAELLSIGVPSLHKGRGIGKTLINYFEKEAIELGCTRIALTTDINSNDEVVNFYLKNGYLVYYEFIAYPNREMFKMIKYLK